MNTKHVAFVAACIPTRILIAWLVHLVSGWQSCKQAKWLTSALLLSIGASFIALYAFRLRMRAPEASGSSGTWWHSLRPVHGALYIVSACLLATGSTWAFLPLVVDVAVGAVAAFHHITSAAKI
jgi:hypothetical protein